jgi:two-component system, NarL family, nitrate/nitrite response regulator NarL
VTTIVICDSEPIAVAGMQALLENVDGVSVLAVESSLSAGIEAVRDLSPKLLIVDKSLGSQSVLDWIAGLRVSDSTTSVVVWSSSLTESEAVRFLQAGACGIARKTAPLQTLIRCVLTVAAGGTWMDGGLVERGFKNREIAVNLGIQTGTVKIHLKHIFEKTGIRGRYGLALSGLKEKGMMAIGALGAESPN